MAGQSEASREILLCIVNTRRQDRLAALVWKTENRKWHFSGVAPGTQGRGGKKKRGEENERERRGGMSKRKTKVGSYEEGRDLEAQG